MTLPTCEHTGRTALDSSIIHPQSMKQTKFPHKPHSVPCTTKYTLAEGSYDLFAPVHLDTGPLKKPINPGNLSEERNGSVEQCYSTCAC